AAHAALLADRARERRELLQELERHDAGLLEIVDRLAAEREVDERALEDQILERGIRALGELADRRDVFKIERILLALSVTSSGDRHPRRAAVGDRESQTG